MAELIYNADTVHVTMKEAKLELGVQPDGGWHLHYLREYDLHPAVLAALKKSAPHDLAKLVFEWPHIPRTDPTRVAYTRNLTNGALKRSTLTSVAKYLTQHFPLESHVIRDLMMVQKADDCSIVSTMPEMLNALYHGPHSCMRWQPDNGDPHPYEVYDPTLGWSMAIRKNGESIDGRALVYGPEGEKPYFVRSYKRDPEGGYSHADEVLEAWLTAKGISKRSSYEGALMKYIERQHGYYSSKFMAPYIDGEVQEVSVFNRDGTKFLRVEEHGEFTCDNTDGSVGGSNSVECDDCGDSMDPDDALYHGVYSDMGPICEYCRDNNYTEVRGRGRRRYLVHNDRAVEVDSQEDFFDLEYLEDNNIVELHDGDFEHRDHTVYVEGVGYYHEDDDGVVLCHDGDYRLARNCVELAGGEYAPAEDAWQCAATKAWYLKGEPEPVIVDGAQYHPDSAPETAIDSAERE